MGWPEWKVGVEYEGEQHWTDPKQYEDDIEHLEFLAAQGWTIVRVAPGSYVTTATGSCDEFAVRYSKRA